MGPVEMSTGVVTRSSIALLNSYNLDHSNYRMQQSKYLLQVIRQSLLERITDISESTLKVGRSTTNRLQFANEICQRQTARLALLVRTSSYFYEHLKKQSGDSLNETTKYPICLRRCIYSATLATFRKMTPSFEPERSMARSDYRSLIELMRQYFLLTNDIKMLWRVEDMAKNKTIKKPTVLAMVVRYVLEVTKEYHQERIKSLNQSITCEEILEFNSLMVLRQQRENFRQENMGNNRTSLGFYNKEKLAVSNINDHAELRFGSEEKRDSGWKLDIAEVKRHRNRLLSRGRQTHTDAMAITSIHDQPLGSNNTLNSMQSTANTRNNSQILNCFIVKSSLTRPYSEVTNHHSLHFDEKEIQTDETPKPIPKPITETLLRPKMALKSMQRRLRKGSGALKQPISKQQMLTKMYDVLEVQDGLFAKLSDPNESSVRAMQASSRIRNKWILRCRLQEQARYKLKKQQAFDKQN